MTKGEQARLVAWRLRVLRAATEAGATTACRHVGLSRKTFYKWKARFEAHGGPGCPVGPAGRTGPRAPHRRRS
jgi:hypothetical protein